MNNINQDPMTWRLIIDPAAEGAWNMALDESVATCAGEGKSPPTLRLYQWEPGCLSLGRAQPFSDINLSGVKEHGWDIVRRPSGGRAILHIDELTYCFAASLDNPLFSGDILESYQRIATGLIQFLNLLGIEADMNYQHPQISQNNQNPICFEVPSQYEITWEGKKIIGSAQARKGNHVLQHGAIPVFGDISRIVSGLNYADENVKSSAREQINNRATTLEAVVKRVIPWQVLTETFVKAQVQNNNLYFLEGTYTQEEIDFAQELKNKKYAVKSWNERI